MFSISSKICVICGGEMLFYWNAQDGVRHTWNYVRCEHCDLIQLLLDEQKADWNKACYSDDYYGDGFAKFTGAIQALRQFSAYRRACEIDRFFLKQGTVLDIGCGEGLFLKSMQDLGWKISGCEIGKRAVKRAEILLKQSIYQGGFETMPPPEIPWNVVMLWHVLEHLPEPVSLFHRLRNTISEDGLLVVAIPNAFSWQAKLFGPHWFHLDPPRHLYSFGLSHLEQMAEHTGWKIVDTRHFSLEYNPYGWAQSFLNCLGCRRDAMYETLKRHDKLVKGRMLLRILAWLLLGPSILPAIFEAIAKRGGTIVVYMRKKKLHEI